MNNSNKDDMVDLALKVGSFLLTTVSTYRNIEETNKKAKREGREAPVDRIKNWLF